MAQATVEPHWMQILQERYDALVEQRNTLKQWIHVFHKLVPYKALNIGEQDVNLLEEWNFDIQTTESKFVNYPPIGGKNMMMRVKMISSIVRRYRRIRYTYKILYIIMCDKLRELHGEKAYAHLKEENACLNLPNMEMDKSMEILNSDDDF